MSQGSTGLGKRKGGSEPHIYGGTPDPILVSERIACELFAGLGVTRRTIRNWIEDGTIARRRIIVNGVEREGLVYQELCVLAQSLEQIPPHE
jgi:hypothetical protein